MGDRGGSTATGRGRADQAVGLCKNDRVYDEDCAKMLQKVRNKCDVDNDDNRDFRRKRERLNKRRKRPKRQQVRNMTWKDKHCKKTLLNLQGDELRKRMEELAGAADELQTDIIEVAKGMGWDMVADAAMKYGGRAAARHGAATLVCGGGGAAGGSVVPGAGTVVGAVGGALVCNVGALVADVGSALWTIWDTWTSYDEISDAVEEGLERLQEARQTSERVLEAIDDPAKLEQLQKDVMDEMINAATEDPCLKARRCFLVPYKPASQGTYGRAEKDLSGGSKKGIFDRAPMDLGDSRGCCPGQTAHHMVLDSWLKSPGSSRGAGDLCGAGKYNMDKAPTVCVEGMNQNTGTHGDVHEATDDRLQRHLDASGGNFSMDDAIDVAADAHAETVGGHCNKACIKDQLRDYYDGMGCNPRPTDKMGRPMGSEGNNNSRDDDTD